MDCAIWLFFAVSATAQDPPAVDTEGEGELPLAIPMPDPPGDAVPIEVPLAPRANRSGDRGPGDGERSRAARAYRERSLALRTFGETHLGTTVDYVPYGHWGPYGYRAGWRAWPLPYVVRTPELGVFQGPKRLDVPNTLAALGDEPARADLDRRIRTHRTLGNVSYGLGVAGVAASVVGLIALDECCSSPVIPGDVETLRRAYTWSTVSISGVALMVGGFVGGTFPSARAQRLQYDYSATLERDALEDRIALHNDQLASELGLSATDAARIEARSRRRERP